MDVSWISIGFDLISEISWGVVYAFKDLIGV
jgi:hypothetical protein